MILLNSLWVSLNQDSSTGVVRGLCLMLHSAHIPNSVKDADVSARTQLPWWQPRHTGHGLGASLPKGSALLSNKIYTTRQLSQGVQNTFASGIFLRMSHVVPQQQIFTTSNWQVWILGCCRYHPETAQHCHHWVPSTSGESGWRNPPQGTVLQREVLVDQHHKGLTTRKKCFCLANVTQHHFGIHRTKEGAPAQMNI